MEKLYIKFIEGDKNSLNEACKKAERLGYKKYNNSLALNFEGSGLLILNIDGEYFTTTLNEIELIKNGRKEHIIKKQPIYVVYVAGGYTPQKEYTDIKKANIEAKRLSKLERKDTFVYKLEAKYSIEVKEFIY